MSITHEPPKSDAGLHATHPVIDGGNLMRTAAIASVCVASILIVTKFAAWLMTDSISLLTTLIDSILDAAASLVSSHINEHHEPLCDLLYFFFPLACPSNSAQIFCSGY